MLTKKKYLVLNNFCTNLLLVLKNCDNIDNNNNNNNNNNSNNNNNNNNNNNTICVNP